MSKQVSLTTICAILAVFGAGTLQVAIAIATIGDIGVRGAFIVAILAAIIMDALVIHQIGTAPTNKMQKGLATLMLVCLFLGLALDVVLLLTHDAFENETFGFLRALVGVNIAVSLVVACGFFAASDTNTHERQLKKLKNDTEMQQARAFLTSPAAALLYRAKATAELLTEAAGDLGVPVYKLTELLGAQDVSNLLETGVPDERPVRRVSSRPESVAPTAEQRSTATSASELVNSVTNILGNNGNHKGGDTNP